LHLCRSFRDGVSALISCRFWPPLLAAASGHRFWSAQLAQRVWPLPLATAFDLLHPPRCAFCWQFRRLMNRAAKKVTRWPFTAAVRCPLMLVLLLTHAMSGSGIKRTGNQIGRACAQ